MEKANREIAAKISKEFLISRKHIEYIIAQTNEGATIPFLTRYRSYEIGEKSGEELREIIKSYHIFESFLIEKQKLSDRADELFKDKEKNDILSKISICTTISQLELLKSSYFPTRKTKAVIAREKGFATIAYQISKNKKDISSNQISTFLIEKYEFTEIIEGAIEILINEFILDEYKRSFVKENLKKYGGISSCLNKEEKIPEKEKKELYKYKLYHNFKSKFEYVKNHQFLALKRAEKKNILKYKFEKNDILKNNFLKYYGKFQIENTQFQTALKHAYSKIFDSVSKELLNESYSSAQEGAIDIFKRNLKQLLYMKPHYEQKVLAIDPGFKNGCKFAICDKLNLYKTGVFRLEHEIKFKILLKEHIKKEKIDTIIVGNGTAGIEVCQLVNDFEKENKINIPIIIVDECGASVYSVTKDAEEEFPNIKPLYISAISLGRRYIDSLSELVKVPVQSLGVGLYQHDISEKKLEEALSLVISDAVNDIGINLNSSSYHLLKYISGLNKTSAKKIHKNLPINSRADLKKILSTKSFQQAVGFILVDESNSYLDKTFIHPEQYKLAEYLLQNQIKLKNNPEKFYLDNQQKLIYLANFELKDHKQLIQIIDLFEESSIDKRLESGTIDYSLLAENLSKKLEVGSELNAVVRNISPFGIFIDAGIKKTILIHSSSLKKIGKKPSDYKISESLKFKISKIDENTGQINGDTIFQ